MGWGQGRVRGGGAMRVENKESSGHFYMSRLLGGKKMMREKIEMEAERG